MTTFESYARGFTRLSLWYARKRIIENLSDFDDALNVRVNIFRNTRFYDGGRHPANGDDFPEWNAALGRVRVVFDARIHDHDTTALEEQSLAILWPDIKACIDTQGDLQKPDSERPYECWSFDYRGDNRLNIHIYNVYRPESPLSEKRDAFAAALIHLLEDSRRNRPDVIVVACGSWLNSMGLFAELFPQAWKDSAVVSGEVRYTMGHWGQFADRTGDFHVANGERFRDTGDFPYACLRCSAPIDAVLNHLKDHFPGAVAHNNSTGDNHNR